MQTLVGTAAVFTFTASSLNLSEHVEVRGCSGHRAQPSVTEEGMKTKTSSRSQIIVSSRLASPQPQDTHRCPPPPVASLTHCTCDSECTFQLSHHGGSTSLKTPGKRHSEKTVPVPRDTFIRKPSPCGIFRNHWHQGPESSEIQAHWASAFLAHVSSSRPQGRHRRG